MASLKPSSLKVASAGKSAQNPVSEQLKFVDSHHPRVESGDYELTVTQEIKALTASTRGLSTKAHESNQQKFSTVHHFSVQGERFSLKPSSVHSHFPAANAIGSYDRYLSHIIFNRSTLPWERSAVKMAESSTVTNVPWLVLLNLTPADFSINPATLKKAIQVQQLSYDEFQTKKLWKELLDKKWLTGDKSSAWLAAPDLHKPLERTYEKYTSQIMAALHQIQQPQVMKLRDLQLKQTTTIKWPGLAKAPLETSQHLEDKVSVIDVSAKTISQIMPTSKELKHLSHVRKPVAHQELFRANAESLSAGKVPASLHAQFKAHGVLLSPLAKVETSISKAKQQTLIHDGINEYLLRWLSKDQWAITLVDTQEYAVVIGNRLAESSDLGSTNIVHLVSVENRYNSNGMFDMSAARDTDSIRFVSLMSWNFTCRSGQKPFRETAEKLNANSLQLPVHAKGDITAKQFSSAGFVPLPHTMRGGQSTVSWYRSPLATSSTAAGHSDQPEGNVNEDLASHPLARNEFPVRAADALVRYDKSLGMFDISYAAAWELGRLLALSSQQFSTELYRWKRAHANQLHKLESQILHPFVPDSSDSEILKSLPKAVISWLSETSLLHRVPFNYLVPDDRMLPPESIRFFSVDSLWVACLMDGAFSIGRITDRDRVADKRNLHHLKNIQQVNVSGVMIRSQLVSDWPGLEVDAYCSQPEKNQVMNPLPDSDKLSRLGAAERTKGNTAVGSESKKRSPNVMFCLFKGHAKTIDLHLHPLTLHFGFECNPAAEPLDFHKKLRFADGKDTNDERVNVKVDRIRKVDIDNLYLEISRKYKALRFESQKLGSGKFALEMIEGVACVRFLIAEAE